MKKILGVLTVFLIALFLQLNSVYAASKCDYAEQVELNDIVANVKVSFEEATGKTGERFPDYEGIMIEETYTYFKISVYNLTEDIFIKVTNDVNDDIKYINYRDSESGVATLEWKDLDKVANFTFTVYSSAKTGCPNEEYRILYLTTPRFNYYSETTKCSGNENFYLCQKYVTEEFTESEFDSQINSFENHEVDEKGEIIVENKTFTDKVFDFINENKIAIIIVSTIIVVGGVVTAVIVIKKRRSRLI